MRLILNISCAGLEEIARNEVSTLETYTDSVPQSKISNYLRIFHYIFYSTYNFSIKSRG